MERRLLKIHEELDELFAEITGPSAAPQAAGRPGPAPGGTLKEQKVAAERQIILEVLRSNNWNRNLTAETLGINRTTLYKKMKRLGLEERRLYAGSPLD